MTKIEDAALSLAPEDRARLAALLIESLDPVEDVDDERIEKLWLEEARVRCEQIDAGLVETIPASEVLESLRKNIS